MSELASQLCTQCGLCCDGTLFEDVELDDEREFHLCENLGLSIDDSQDEFLLSQPCKALKESQCTVYLHRPQCCRTFYCHLFNQVQQSKITLQKALEDIHALKSAKKSLLELLSQNDFESPHLPLRSRIQEALGNEAQLSKQVNEEVEVLYEALNAKAKRMFKVSIY